MKRLALLSVFLALPLCACKVFSASPPLAPGVSALNLLKEVQADVAALQSAEIAAVNAKLIDAATDAKIQAAFKQEAVDATALAQAISAASGTATVQSKVDTLISDLQNDVANGVAGIKDQNTKAVLIASLAAAEIAVNGIMEAYNQPAAASPAAK